MKYFTINFLLLQWKPMTSCEFKILPSFCIWFICPWLFLIRWLWISSWQLHSSRSADRDLSDTESIWEAACPWLMHSKKSGNTGHGRERSQNSFFCTSALDLFISGPSGLHWAKPLRPEDTITQVRHHTSMWCPNVSF